MTDSDVSDKKTRGVCVARWTGAVCLWLGLGLSLGWYYTVTYYGRSGWPMPIPDACATLLLYYFSVLNVSTGVQAVHWMIAFPAAGILWVASLWILAPRFGEPRPSFSSLLLRMSAANAPLVAAGPFMTYVAGWNMDVFSAHRIVQVALRRGFLSPWPMLTPTYVILGIIALFFQIRVYRAMFGCRGTKAWRHFLAATILLSISASVIGALAAIPLRFIFE
jgi:hypothetical protein